MYESRIDEAFSPAGPRLLGDIGGTHARFAWQSDAGAAIERVSVLQCAQHATLADAIQAYLAGQALGVPTSAALGMANPVTGDWVAMTNHHWKFSIRQLRETLGFKRLLVLNDFTALALSLITLPASSRRQVGGGLPDAQSAIALIGAGTGLGVSGLIPTGVASPAWVPLRGEGGHVTLSASNAEEFAVMAHLQKRYGHVSAERVLSGMGLVDLLHALIAVRGHAAQDLGEPAQVLHAALTLRDPVALDTVQMFCGFLGTVAGDLALTLGARGGVYVGGGLVPRLGQVFDASPFRARFEAKGRFESYLRDIPVWVIDSPVSPALEGAAQALSLSGH